MIRQLIKVLFLLVAIVATVFASHLFRYDVIMEVPEAGAVGQNVGQQSELPNYLFNFNSLLIGYESTLSAISSKIPLV